MKARSILPICELCAAHQDSLFAHASHVELQEITDSKNCISYKAGQFIFQEGERCDGIYCLMTGKVKMTKTTTGGQEHILRLCRPGDALGVMTLVTGDRYMTNAVTLEDCRVCFIPTPVFKHVLEHNSKAASDVLFNFSKALESSEAQATIMALKPVRERLAEGLLLLQKVYGAGRPEPFSIDFTRENLANLIGTAKETVVRFLSEFKEAGIIQTNRSNITLLKPQKLQTIINLYD